MFSTTTTTITSAPVNVKSSLTDTSYALVFETDKFGTDVEVTYKRKDHVISLEEKTKSFMENFMDSFADLPSFERGVKTGDDLFSGILSVSVAVPETFLVEGIESFIEDGELHVILTGKRDAREVKKTSGKVKSHIVD